MLSDRVSNPGPLTYESGALPIALRGPAVQLKREAKFGIGQERGDIHTGFRNYQTVHLLSVISNEHTIKKISEILYPSSSVSL